MTATTLDQLRQELLAKPAVREAYGKQAAGHALLTGNRDFLPMAEHLGLKVLRRS